MKLHFFIQTELNYHQNKDSRVSRAALFLFQYTEPQLRLRTLLITCVPDNPRILLRKNKQCSRKWLRHIWFLIWPFCSRCWESMDYALVEVSRIKLIWQTYLTDSLFRGILSHRYFSNSTASFSRFLHFGKTVLIAFESVLTCINSQRRSPCYEEFKRQTRKNGGGINIMVEFFRVNFSLV